MTTLYLLKVSLELNLTPSSSVLFIQHTFCLLISELTMNINFYKKM